MAAKMLTDRLSVSPQLSPDDIDAAAARGVRMVVNNRPDGEEVGQPGSAELAARADAAGVDYRHIPVVSGKIDDSDVAAFAKALDDADGPVLAFCRTGTRSSQLWALAARDRLSTDEVIRMAATAGYDLSGMQERLEVGV